MAWQPILAPLPGESHGQRSLVDYSPWVCKESNITERLTLSFFTFLVALQCCVSFRCSAKWFSLWIYVYMGFSGDLVSKESACIVGDLGSILGLGRSPREWNGNPLQYSCLENPMYEESGGLQSMGSQRVGHDWVTNTFEFTTHKTSKAVTSLSNKIRNVSETVYHWEEGDTHLAKGVIHSSWDDFWI